MSSQITEEYSEYRHGRMDLRPVSSRIPSYGAIDHVLCLIDRRAGRPSQRARSTTVDTFPFACCCDAALRSRCVRRESDRPHPLLEGCWPVSIAGSPSIRVI